MRWRGDLALCGWCLAAVTVEIGLYLSYGHHDARFHWFTHFFVGASAALLVMSGVAAAIRRAVPFPLVWPMLGHLVAMLPDFLFRTGIAHERWMDVFLGHVSSHFVPGRNLTWYLVFLLSLGVYLAVLDRLTPTATGPHPRAIHRPLEDAYPRRCPPPVSARRIPLDSVVTTDSTLAAGEQEGGAVMATTRTEARPRATAADRIDVLLIFVAFLLSTPTLAGERTVRLQVDNMDCAACPLIVKQSLARVSGVTKVEVSYAQKTASVTYDDARVAVTTLSDATTKAGYLSREAP